MNVHCFQHVPFEGLGAIAGWLDARSAKVSATRFFDAPNLPDLRDVDWLIVMGGPMSVNDESVHPWLRTEKQFIAEAIARDKVVLGICLGAQLIASALGSSAYVNGEKEIGWFPIERVPAGSESRVARVFPDRIDVFHWHGETFDLPSGAQNFARSAACAHQAFSIGNCVLGLQFHLEMTLSSMRALIDNCRGDLAPGAFVQSEAEMARRTDRFDDANALLRTILDYLARTDR